MIEDYPEEHRNAVAMELAWTDYKEAAYSLESATFYLRRIHLDDAKAEGILKGLAETLSNVQDTIHKTWDVFGELKREVFGDPPLDDCPHVCEPGAGE